MRKIIYLGQLFFLLLLATAGAANRVVIKGSVKFPNGVIVANFPVLLRTDSISTTNVCFVTKTVKTNVNGVYEAALECPIDIPKVFISYKACNQYFTVEKSLPSTAIIEYNIQICAPTACLPNFRWEAAITNPLSVTVNSSASLAGDGDEIVKRVYTWGDGTTTEGNFVSTMHNYASGGTFQVCLKTVTRNGCENTFCQNLVLILPANTECKPAFYWTRQSDSSFIFKFNSKNSVASISDSIIGRRWSWGDGTFTEGNLAEVSHQFSQPGKYEVCLLIRSKNGCEKKLCQLLVIEAPRPKCQAYFIATIQPVSSGAQARMVKFNGSSSSASGAGDSIVQRKWFFGDGMVSDGNISEISHLYQKAGTYKVCLVIKTTTGCVSELCKNIILESPVLCEAGFSSQSQGLKAFFESGLSKTVAGDSITSRTWIWGDGKQLVGNVASPAHEYGLAGQYEVCLNIKTGTGCESRICRQVTIIDVNSKCLPFFTLESLPERRVRFNSNGSVSQIAEDSIVRRHWDFGDGSSLSGNIVSPLHDYKFGGTYTVCLTIVTKKGCESRWCHSVKVEGNSLTDEAYIKLIALYPNPVKEVLFPVVWSKNAGIKAEISIMDVYGQVKYAREVILPQGNSTLKFPVQSLLSGPYLLRISTIFGIRKANFYKIN